MDTGFGALAAADATIAVDPRPGSGRRGIGQRTCLPTLTTAYTPLGTDHQFGLGRAALGVVTPRAAQRTPLQENRRTDSRSIVNRITLDIEDQTTEHLAVGVIAPTPVTKHDTESPAGPKGTAGDQFDIYPQVFSDIRQIDLQLLEHQLFGHLQPGDHAEQRGGSNGGCHDIRFHVFDVDPWLAK
jgi:hypothetical protein